MPILLLLTLGFLRAATISGRICVFIFDQAKKMDNNLCLSVTEFNFLNGLFLLQPKKSDFLKLIANFNCIWLIPPFAFDNIKYYP